MDRLFGAFRLDPSDAEIERQWATLSATWSIKACPVGEVHLIRDASPISSSDPALTSFSGTVPSWLEWAHDLVTFDQASDLFQGGFRFTADDEDAELSEWAPQGLTGSADASHTGQVDGRKFLLVAWHSQQVENSVDSDDRIDIDGVIRTSIVQASARISLVDVTSMQDINYRHILLVVPSAAAGPGGFHASFNAYVGHCGGVVWYGRYLYVTGNDRIVVFDMEGIRDLYMNQDGTIHNAEFATTRKVGWHDNKYHAYGYRYICPAVRVHLVSAFGDLAGRAPFDSMGLDRSQEPHRLVTAAHTDNEDTEVLVLFWSLNRTEQTLVETAGYIEAADAADARQPQIQGVVAAGETVWFCISATQNLLLRRTIGSRSGQSHDWANMGEGLTYAPLTDHLWNVTEKQSSRICFFVSRADVGG